MKTWLRTLRKGAEVRLRQRSIDVPWSPRTALLICDVLAAASSLNKSALANALASDQMRIDMGVLEACLDALIVHVEVGGSGCDGT